MNRSDMAKQVASAGRYGDTELIHINRDELAGIAAMSPVGLTQNPETGLPEAFIFPLLAGMAGSMLGPTLGISATLGSAIGSGLAGWAESGDLGQGLMSGVLGYAGGELLGGGGGEAANAAESIAATSPTTPFRDAGVMPLPMGGAGSGGGSGGIANGILGLIQDNPGAMFGGALGLASLLNRNGYEATLPGQTGGSGQSFPAPTPRGNPRFPSTYSHGRNPEWRYYQEGGEVERPYIPPGNRVGRSGTGTANPNLARESSDTGRLMAMERLNRLIDLQQANPDVADTVAVEMGYEDAIQAINELSSIATGGAGASRAADPGILSRYYHHSSPLGNIAPTPDEFNMESSIPGYQQGGPVAPGQSDMMTQSPTVDAQGEMLVNQAIAAIQGKHPSPMVVLSEFAKRYGMEALRRLRQRVLSQQNAGREIEGPGSGMSDSVPAMVDGQEPAALSAGEYVIPADVVSALGDGYTDEGVRQLDDMVSRTRYAKTGDAQMPAPIDPNRMMPA